MLKLIFAFTAFISGSTTFAQTSNRDESLSAARVWVKPPWISPDFKFSNLDVAKGPAKTGWETRLEQNPLTCTVTEKDLGRATHGMTNKFYCSFDEDHSAKFKYKFDDGEITGEILGTRLFWALGFGADRVYYVDELRCAGCTSNPFHDRRIDQRTLKKPRVFKDLAVERKFSKTSIGRGWTFEELMNTASDENFIERDALRLLSVFVQHADNKAENQDLVCDGKETKNGGCSGQTFMLIQDLGATFGSGQIDYQTMSKSVLEDWQSKKLWSNRKRCLANLGMNAEGDMEEPEISEEARAFLAKLMTGFSEGPEGRKRVQALFEAGYADMRGGSIKEWVDTFYVKVKELNQPCGK